MKSILRTVLLALILFVVISALVKSNQNGKSFWYNAGHQMKTAVVWVVDVSKDAFSDAKDGYKE